MHPYLIVSLGMFACPVSCLYVSKHRVLLKVPLLYRSLASPCCAVQQCWCVSSLSLQQQTDVFHC